MTQRGKHFFLLAFLLFSISTVAQVDVKGTIIEEQSKEAIEQATVRLLNMKDSSMVNGTVSSRNGAFMLRSVKEGNYILHVTFVGYEPVYQLLKVTNRTNPIDVDTAREEGAHPSRLVHHACHQRFLRAQARGVDYPLVRCGVFAVAYVHDTFSVRP